MMRMSVVVVVVMMMMMMMTAITIIMTPLNKQAKRELCGKFCGPFRSALSTKRAMPFQRWGRSGC
eukprot:scaffold33236_cov66-Skeletonema_marinoi.AAC.1